MRILNASLCCILGFALLFPACGVESKSICDAPLTCDEPATEGGIEGGADVMQPPAGCDPAADPKDAPKCVVSDFGVFVDATNGADASPGTKEQPVKTIGGALGKLGNKSRVYICEGTYAEHLKVTRAVTLYGGFACGAWSYSGAKPRVHPTDGASPALDVAASNVTLSDLEFVGADLGAPNSVAVRAVDSSALLFLRTKLEGRAGADGQAGTRADFAGLPSQSDLNGIDANAGAAGGERSVNCPGPATTKGGKGGASGFDGDPGTPTLAGGAGGTVSQCQMSNTGGQPGSPGTTPSAAAGAQTTGVLMDTDWAPQTGVPGSNGGPGQGGGGGAGLGGGFGGGGGAGGCGGAGGGAGKGGGASIALLSIRSVITLRASEVSTGKAGPGGTGKAGQQGQQIFGAGGNKFGLGCGGGNGGKGGDGGAGGGGAGGISVAVLYKGAKPIMDSTQVTAGDFGAKGTGGTPGANDGVDGKKGEALEIQ